MATISNNEIKIKYTLDTTDLANATALFDRLSAEDRQLLNDLRRLQAQFNATGQAGQQAGNQMAGAAANANRQFSGLQNQIKSAFAVGAIISFTKSVIDATVKMQGLQKAIEFTSGSLAGGAANFAFIERLAEKLGLPLQAAAEGFKTFSAAANRAGYTIMQQRQMFTDLSKAMAALQLDSQSAQLVFFGFGQLMSKNKVSAQELYHQIGERLPIAMEAAQIAAAKITGQLKVTSGELIKLVEDGKLLSTEFAPEFTKALGELSKSAAYVETLGKDVNRLETAWESFKVALADNKFIGLLVNGLTLILNGLDGIASRVSYVINAILNLGDIPLTYAGFKALEEETIRTFDLIQATATSRFSEVEELNKQYQKTLTDDTEAGMLQRLVLEAQYAEERKKIVEKLAEDIEREEKNIIVAGAKLRASKGTSDEQRFYKELKIAESALASYKKLLGTIPELKTLLPDPEAEKKKNKALEDEYRKIIAAIEARKTAEDNYIKARTKEGYTRDIQLLKNNVKFNNEMLSIDESARFKNLELAKNNAVKRKGENERDTKEQIKIRKKALDEALAIEKDYIEKNRKVLDQAALKRKESRQTDLRNEIDAINLSTKDKIDEITKAYEKEIKIQELSDATRKQLTENFNAERAKINNSALNDQLLALKKYYDEQERLDEEAAFDRNDIYAKAATRRLAADAKNEYDRQDILDKGTIAEIANEKERLKAQEKRIQASLILTQDYKDREAALIKAKLEDLASQEYEIQVNAEKRKREKMLEIVQASADAMAQIFNDIGNVYIANLDRQREALSQKYDADVRLADGNKQKLAQLAQEKARAEYEIELKQFKARQIMAVAEVIFKTAPEIAKWISTGVLAPVAAIGLAAQGFAIGAILSQPPPVPPYKDGTKGRPHPGGPALVGEAGTERVVTTDGQVYYTPPMATLIDLPKGAQVIPNHALSRKELFWANAMNQGRPIDPESGIGRKLDKIGGILEAMPVHQINMNERGFEKFIRTPRRTSKILNNQFPSKL